MSKAILEIEMPESCTEDNDELNCNTCPLKTLECCEQICQQGKMGLAEALYGSIKRRIKVRTRFFRANADS